MLSDLQKRYNELQGRLDAMYLDKLDGKISEEIYLRLREKTVSEQASALRSLKRHRSANTAYLDQGVKLLELARKAPSLYQKQEGPEKRRPLNIVHSNSTWHGDHLIPEYRKPFDLLAVTNEAWRDRKSASPLEDGRPSIWLPMLDTFRTLCFMPIPEISGTFEKIGQVSAG
jgi:site-specific DNA recombinase